MKRAWMVIVCLSLLSGCTWVRQQWPWNRQAADKHGTTEVIRPIAEGPAPAPVPAKPAAKPAPARSVAADWDATPAKPVPTSAPAASESTDSHAGNQISGKPQVVDALMLMVNNQVITVNEVIHPVRERLNALSVSGGEQAFREKARQILAMEVRRQVGETLVLKEADRFLSEDEKKQVDQDLQEHIRDRIALMGGSKTRLDQELRKQGTTLQEATNVQRREMISRLYLRKKFLPQLAATRDQLWQYYQNHSAEFSTPKKVQMQVLMVAYKGFVPPDSDALTAAELAVAKKKAAAKAEEALARIKDGEDFGEVVDEMGGADSPQPGGVWDFMPAGSFREKAVEDAAFDQEAGQVSKVILAERGAYIVKTRDIQPGKVVSFEVAQDDIDKKIRDKQYDDLTMEYFSKLASKANIVQAEEFEKLILDRAVQQYYRPRAGQAQPE